MIHLLLVGEPGILGEVSRKLSPKVEVHAGYDFEAARGIVENPEVEFDLAILADQLACAEEVLRIAEIIRGSQPNCQVFADTGNAGLDHQLVTDGLCHGKLGHSSVIEFTRQNFIPATTT